MDNKDETLQAAISLYPYKSLPNGITPRQLGAALAEINKHLAHMQDKLEDAPR